MMDWQLIILQIRREYKTLTKVSPLVGLSAERLRQFELWGACGRQDCRVRQILTKERKHERYTDNRMADSFCNSADTGCGTCWL